MSYITADKIRDELLAPLVVEADLLDADEYLDAIATDLDVTVATPVTNWRVIQLLIARTCVVCARRKAGMQPSRGHMLPDGMDAFTQKQRMWQRELDEHARAVTGAMISGDDADTAATAGEITLERA